MSDRWLTEAGMRRVYCCVVGLVVVSSALVGCSDTTAPKPTATVASVSVEGSGLSLRLVGPNVDFYEQHLAREETRFVVYGEHLPPPRGGCRFHTRSTVPIVRKTSVTDTA